MLRIIISHFPHNISLGFHGGVKHFDSVMRNMRAVGTSYPAKPIPAKYAAP